MLIVLVVFLLVTGGGLGGLAGLCARLALAKRGLAVPGLLGERGTTCQQEHGAQPDEPKRLSSPGKRLRCYDLEVGTRCKVPPEVVMGRHAARGFEVRIEDGW